MSLDTGAATGQPAAAPGPVLSLAAADAAACKALSDGAGWQHTLEDWQVRLAAGHGFGICVDGRLACVAVVFAYPDRAAFLGMLLTDPPLRGQGLAGALSQHCIGWAADRGLPLCLIAVPRAVPLYLRLGLKPIAGEGLASLRFTGPVGLGAAGPTRAAVAGDIAAIAALDALAVGYDRAALLADHLARGAAYALLAEGEGRVTGFALAVQRGDTLALGPCVAKDDVTAQALLARQLAMVPPGQLARLDVPCGQTALLSRLAGIGITPHSNLAAMADKPAPGLPHTRPEMVFAAYSAVAG